MPALVLSILAQSPHAVNGGCAPGCASEFCVRYAETRLISLEDPFGPKTGTAERSLPVRNGLSRFTFHPCTRLRKTLTPTQVWPRRRPSRCRAPRALVEFPLTGLWRSGSALPWHGRGQGFDSPQVHQRISERAVAALFLSGRDPQPGRRRGLIRPESAAGENPRLSTWNRRPAPSGVGFAWQAIPRSRRTGDNEGGIDSPTADLGGDGPRRRAPA